ncbi:hypothetical protein QYE76_027849 [Lolium multiflorum]|uniref:Aminotransferase-like plant mobile domain-containing protein n=1 Tax=Lolium multiflorum TaxID=4521 RepID=A0AAD8VGF8_LOLMU|nr:hypothetical protein QYE76_027849 [Lolium multiflorum]
MAESSNANAMVSGLKNENILKTIGYFWSDALNCFMFGHGPMTPTLDVAMITGLDIASSSPSFKLPKIPNFPPLATCTFPNASGKQIRCTSYGQALYSLPGSKLIPKEASEWFRTFFQGLDNPLFFPYTESENFENPVSFRLDSFADDPSTRHLYSIMIRPCFLPVGMSTSNRIIKPGYESYQPVVAARQFGLGQVPPHFFLHHLTESRAELPDILTSQRCYPFFDALSIPIPHNLRFTTTTDGFETWWSLWKTHAFRRALGPLLKQLDAEYDVPADQQDGPEPMQADGSPFKFLPPAPVVLFCQSSPPLKKVIMQSQPISPKSAPKSKASSGPVAPRASIQARKAVRKVAARKTLKRQAPTPAQESLHTSTEENPSEEAQSSRRDSSSAPIRTGSRVKRRCVKRARKDPRASPSSQEVSHTNETSSGDVEEILMPSATLDLATSKSAADKEAILTKPTEKPITTTSAVPPILGEGCDLSSLLTFDPESIEPATSKAGEEPSPSTAHGPLQRLKALLSSSIETLVENPEEVKGILEDIHPHLPVTLQVKLWPAVTRRSSGQGCSRFVKELTFATPSCR